MMTQENIGKFIAEKRRENNMTQEQFAEKLGVSNRSISRWENGKTMPDYSLFPMICETLKVNISELLEGNFSENNDALKDKMHLIEELLDYEKQKKQRMINRCLLIWSICLVLKMLHNQFGILDFVSNANLLVDLLLGLRILCICVILYYNNQKQKYTENELRVFLGVDQDTRMRTAGEMLTFTKRNQKSEFKQYQKAFQAIEEKLLPEEAVVFAMVADTVYVDENWRDGWKPWHVALAVTEDRILVCGEAIHGRFMTYYDVESFDIARIVSVEMIQGKIVMKFTDYHVLTIEGKELEVVIELFKKAL